MPGVAINVNWDAGEDTFYTGLKPEFDLGYADFEMTPSVFYDVHLEGGGELTGLTSLECETTAGERYWGSWRVNFIQPILPTATEAPTEETTPTPGE